MASSHRTISPFPGDINRESFGHWLSGFTDGEGHFALAMHHPGTTAGGTGSAKFALGLRDDDHEILVLIQSYWQCGTLQCRQKMNTPHGHSQTVLQIARTEDLLNIVIPHFEQFPLRAKKARDFLLWCRGVQLAHAIWIRKRNRRPYGHGTLPKWTDGERTEFVALREALIQTRVYRGNPPPVEQPKQSEQRMLW